MNKLISIFLIVGTMLHAGAQPLNQYTFTHYSTATGLPSNQVYSIVQDAEGYIWLGTTDGIVRFDGTRYQSFQHNDRDSSSIPSNAIAQLVADKQKRLWVVAFNGRVGIFDTKKFVFREATVKPKSFTGLKTATKKLITDEKGNIFLLLSGFELLAWNEKTNEFTAADSFLHTKDNWKFTAFAHQPGTEKYWMSVEGIGIVVFNKASGQLSYATNNVEKEAAVEKFAGISSMFISNFLFDKKGRLWFTAWGPGYPYVNCYDVKNEKIVLDKYEFLTVLKTYNEINGIMEQEDGTIWLNGLKVFAHYNEQEKKFEMVQPGYTNERSIDYRLISSLYEDKEMNIWVGTGNNGIFRFNPSQEFFTNVRHTSRSVNTYGDGNPLSYLTDKDGTLLVGTWGDGLYRYDKNFKIIPVNIKGIGDKNFINVWDMCYSRDSSMAWFSSQPGLYAYNFSNHSAAFYNPPVLENKTVRQIAEDKNGNLWLGMQGFGVFKWNAKKGRIKFEDGITRFGSIPATDQINNITVDSKGYVWVGTATDGMYLIDAGTDQVLKHFQEKAKGIEHLPEEGISAILEYNDSLMVISTATRLIIYNRLRQRTRLLGAPETMSGYIASLQKDDSGNLWISTTVALYRATIKTRVFVRFNRDDGINNDYFTLASSHKLPGGTLLFGSSGQFVAFNPSAIFVSTMKAEIAITGFKVMNKPLQVDSLLRLKYIALGYENNSLAVDFSTLNYISAYLILYKMDDIDKDWKIADKNNQAIYSYLPPGKYELQFKTIDGDGKSVINPLKLAIVIEAPFWKNWWFYSLLVLAAGGLLFWLDKERTKRKEAVQKMRIDIAGNLHEEVNTALNNINILSEMARLKADSEPQKSKEFIEQIHNKSHKMIIAMDDMLWSISPDNDSMEKTVLRMQEFIDALNNRKGLHIKIQIEEKVKQLKLNMQFRHEAFVLFKKSIYDLSKVADAVYHVNVVLEKMNLVYRISFSNKTAEEEKVRNTMEKLQKGKHAADTAAVISMFEQQKNSIMELKMPVE